MRLLRLRRDGTVSEVANGLQDSQCRHDLHPPPEPETTFSKTSAPTRKNLPTRKTSGTEWSFPWISLTAMAAIASPSPATASMPGSPKRTPVHQLPPSQRPGQLPGVRGDQLPLPPYRQPLDCSSGRRGPGGQLCPGVHMQRALLRRRLHPGAPGPMNDGVLHTVLVKNVPKPLLPGSFRLLRRTLAGSSEIPDPGLRRPGGAHPVGNGHRHLPGRRVLPQPGRPHAPGGQAPQLFRPQRAVTPTPRPK